VSGRLFYENPTGARLLRLTTSAAAKKYQLSILFVMPWQIRRKPTLPKPREAPWSQTGLNLAEKGRLVYKKAN